MEMVEVVIRISKQLHDDIKKSTVCGEHGVVRCDLLDAVADGIVLPKGHGRLIDEQDAIDTLSVMFSGNDEILNDALECIEQLPEIIQADGGNELDEKQKRDCHTCHYMSENAEFDGEMCVGCLADFSGNKPCYKE